MREDVGVAEGMDEVDAASRQQLCWAFFGMLDAKVQPLGALLDTEACWWPMSGPGSGPVPFQEFEALD